MKNAIENLGFRINDMQHISGRDFLRIPIKEAILLDVSAQNGYTDHH